MVSQYRQRQLRRTIAAVSPLEPGRTVIPQVQPGIERASVHRDDGGVTLPASRILLQDAPKELLHFLGGQMFWLHVRLGELMHPDETEL